MNIKEFNELLAHMSARMDYLSKMYHDKKPCAVTETGDLLVIAYMCGAEFEFIKTEAGMDFVTKRPVGVCWDGEKFNLFQGPKI